MIEMLDRYFEGGLIQSLFVSAFVVVFGYVVYFLVRKFLDRVTIDNEPTILRIVKAAITALCAYVILKRIIPLHGLLTAIIASSGVVALTASLAAQDSLSNIIAGLIIVLTKPYKIGDLIKVDNGKYIGYVEAITLRHTLIRTYENNRIAIPNTSMNSSPIENYDMVDSQKANFLEVSISYESDLDTAMNVLKTLADKHPESLGNTTVKVIGFGDSGINLRATVLTENSLKGFNVLSQLRHDIIYAFKENNIEIPYPTRSLTFKEDNKKQSSKSSTRKQKRA